VRVNVAGQTYGLLNFAAVSLVLPDQKIRNGRLHGDSRLYKDGRPLAKRPGACPWAFLARGEGLLWGQREVVERDTEAGGVGILAHDCEFERIVSRRWECEISIVDDGVAFRGKILIEWSAHVGAIDRELRNPTVSISFVGELDIVRSSLSHIHSERDTVSDSGGVQDGSCGVREAGKGERTECGARAHRRQSSRPVDDGSSGGTRLVHRLRQYR